MSWLQSDMSWFQADLDAANVKIPPPLVCVFVIVLGLLAQAYIYAVTLPLPTWANQWGAALLVLIGAVFAAASLGQFWLIEQDPHPWKYTPSVITTGIYAVTRNPMYLAMALVQAGIGLRLDNAWIFLFTPIFMWSIYMLAIRHEETYLLKKFSEQYLQYTIRVRRWL